MSQENRREKGTGNIAFCEGKRKPWRATLIVDGKKKSKFFSTEREAKAFLRNSSSKEILKSKDCPTISVFSVFFLNQKKRKMKTGSYETLEGNVKLITDRWGTKLLSTVDNDALQSLIYSLADEEYSVSTLSKVKNITTAMVRMAAAKGYVSHMPVFDITIPQPKNQGEIQSAKTNYLNVKELAAYEAECIRTYQPAKYTKNYGKTLLAHPSGWKLSFLVHTGLRIGEALALTWDDYDKKSKTLLINKNTRRTKSQGKITQSPKTEAGERVIILNKKGYQDIQQLKAIFDEQTKELEAKEAEALAKAVDKAEKEAIKKRYKTYRENHKYICGSSTFPYGASCANSIRTTHDKICEIIKPSHDVTLHGLRHTYVTHYYLNHKNDPDFDLPTFSRSIGHASVRVTMDIYAHLKMVETQNGKRAVADLKDF